MNHPFRLFFLLSLVLGITIVSPVAAKTYQSEYTSGETLSAELGTLLPCLSEGWLTRHITGTFKRQPTAARQVQLRVDATADFTFTPTDPTLPTYTSGPIPIDTSYNRTSAESRVEAFDIVLTIPLYGSDGSVVVLEGVAFTAFVARDGFGLGSASHTLHCA